MKVLIYDIETYKEIFLLKIYNPENEQWFDFYISRYENNFDSFFKFIDEYKEYYWVGYNCLRFDSQVLEWIIRNYNNWHDLSNLEICGKICQKAQDIIDDANYELFPEYREEQLSLKQIDLFKLLHYDNKNRRVSLKRVEFELDMELIEELPIHFLKENLTKEEIEEIQNYCKNDVWATYQLYLVVIGNTEHPLYKGNNQIQLRLDIEEEFGFKCLNFSDSKIGDEIIKKYYCEEKGISYNDLPKKGFFRKEIQLKHCIAPYIKFQTKELQEFLKKIKNVSLGNQDDFKEEVSFYGNMYSFMKGGLHSENKPKIFQENNEALIIDWDVSSYYPAIIINGKKYPYHLGKEFLSGYKRMYEKRLELKPLAKTDKRIKGIVGALKLSVNSVYGKSSDMQSWIFDKQLTLYTTITGELSLMMLIEAYELAGIKVISANTDGVTILINKSLLSKMEEINKQWKLVTQFELENTDYKKIVFASVNDYIAVKLDNETKKKGDFVTDFELQMNKSARIVPLALEQYYLNNIPVEQTIKNHKNIYDFCIRQKSSKDFHYKGVSNERTNIYKKLIRYYVSLDGEKLFKVKEASCQTNAAEISIIEKKETGGQYLCHICNYLSKDTKIEDCKIDYQYYIDKANKIISKIETLGKKTVKKIENQMSLFG